MEDFEKALTKFIEADSGKMLEGAYGIFLTITTMTIEEVVAAKQALDLFRQVKRPDDSQEKILQTFYVALKQRCRVLWLGKACSTEDPKWNSLYQSIADTFGSEVIRHI